MKTMPLLAAFLLVVTNQTITAQDTLTLREAFYQGPDEVRRSIEAGADVNQKYVGNSMYGASDTTPLFEACIYFLTPDPVFIARKNEIIRLLIDAGANVNERFHARNERIQGVTVLIFAVFTREDHTSMIEPLVAGGLDIDAKDFSEQTALHVAAVHGRTVWLEPLIDNGAELEARDLRYRTPLFLAVLNNNKEAAEILITKGADVNAKSDAGQTPLDIAVHNKDKDLADLIRNNGGISGNQ